MSNLSLLEVMIGTSGSFSGKGGGGGGGVAEMSTFNFLICKSIFHLSEHHKFEYFSHQWCDIQVCEKIKFMERSESNGLFRNIRQALHEAQ